MLRFFIYDGVFPKGQSGPRAALTAVLPHPVRITEGAQAPDIFFKLTKKGG